MPGIKATGTKTNSNTKVMARIGPVTSAVAFLQASRTDSWGSGSITRSMFSTTTMASSTTAEYSPRWLPAGFKGGLDLQGCRPALRDDFNSGPIELRS
jgi:hypothetical protein